MLSSFSLKLIAIISMLIDHSENLFPNNIVWMRIIGRLAFPIFAWQIAVGYKHTKDLKLYMYRLFICAIISQPIYMVHFNIYDRFNIIFTFILALISIKIFDTHKVVGIIAIAGMCIVAEYFNFEYGVFGILTVAIFYIFMDNKILLLIMQIINTLVYVVIWNVAKIQLFCLISVIIIIMLYNGKKGIKIKYLFYAFYPMHIVILYIIKQIIIKN